MVLETRTQSHDGISRMTRELRVRGCGHMGLMLAYREKQLACRVEKNARMGRHGPMTSTPEWPIEHERMHYAESRMWQRANEGGA